MYYEVYNPFINSIYLSFKVKDGITSEDIESVIYDLENILNDKSTIDMLDELTDSFKKNKFIQYLPFKLRKNLKMELIFDKDALLESTMDKSINFIETSKFRKGLFKEID